MKEFLRAWGSESQDGLWEPSEDASPGTLASVANVGGVAMSRLTKRSGFTLIELLVVVIIVAVLAAVGIPLLTGNIERARLSEADAGLGTIRTSLRARLAEFGNYTGAVLSTSSTGGNIGITANDLCGRFFSVDDYAFVGTPGATFCVGVTGSGANGTCPGGAPRGRQVAATLWRAMDQDGHIYGANTGSPSCAGTPLN